MRRLLLCTGLLVMLAAPAFAQGQGGGGGGGRMMGPPKSGQGLFKDITLTADQQKRIDSVWKSNEPMREQMRSQMEKGQRPDSAMRQHMMQMREQTNKTYRSILTADQQKTFDKNVAEMKERMMQMGPAGEGKQKT